jgi:hypothetical protein
MAESKHAPGPWHVVEDAKRLDVRAADGEPICSLWTRTRRVDADCANAKLIAASPALADALDELLAGDVTTLDANVVEAARAALLAAGRLP